MQTNAKKLSEQIQANNEIKEEDEYFSFGKLKTTSIVLDGDGTETYLPANIRTHLDPQLAIFFEEVMQVKQKIQYEQEENRRNGRPYQWNGEKYQISKIVMSREPTFEHMTLDIWLKSRDHFTGLATRRNLEDPVFREKYLPEDWAHPVTSFSCSIGVDITVISSDGYIILTQRGANQSVHQGAFNCSVSEAVSPSFDRSTTSRAPDLYRCASRGLAEEIGLQEPADFSSSDILFLSFSVDTRYALYNLRGMVKVKKRANEIIQNWHAGVKDKMENKKIFAVPFNPQDTDAFALAHQPWTGGIISVYHALVHEFGRREVNTAINS
jgi:hypothetical protein